VIERLVLALLSVHYAYGNVDYAQKRWEAAKRSYEQSLRIGLASAPIHPITAAAYYSLGCVEHMRGNFDNAKCASLPLSPRNPRVSFVEHWFVLFID
jgi:tetratricopeptide (TPR) repeat protein